MPLGKRGCLETIASEWGMMQQMKLRLSQGAQSIFNDKSNFTTNDIYLAARQGDKLATEIMENALYYLRITIANLVTLLNPEQLILSGTLWQNPALLQSVFRPF